MISRIPAWVGCDESSTLPQLQLLSSLFPRMNCLDIERFTDLKAVDLRTLYHVDEIKTFYLPANFDADFVLVEEKKLSELTLSNFITASYRASLCGSDTECTDASAFPVGQRKQATNFRRGSFIEVESPGGLFRRF